MVAMRRGLASSQMVITRGHYASAILANLAVACCSSCPSRRQNNSLVLSDSEQPRACHPFPLPSVTLISSPPHVALVEIVHNSASGCGASVIQVTQTLCIPLCFRDLFLQS